MQYKDIKEGMAVLDHDKNKIGTVKHVQFGDEDLGDPGAETATTAGQGSQRDDSLIENIAEALAPASGIPESVRKHMLRYGYIRIDTPPLQSDRYAAFDQIAGIEDDQVVLKVSDEALPTG